MILGILIFLKCFHQIMMIVLISAANFKTDFTGCVSKQSLRKKSLAIKVRWSLSKSRMYTCYMLKTRPGSGQHLNVFLKDLSPL